MPLGFNFQDSATAPGEAHPGHKDKAHNLITSLHYFECTAYTVDPVHCTQVFTLLTPRACRPMQDFVHVVTCLGTEWDAPLTNQHWLQTHIPLIHTRM